MYVTGYEIGCVSENRYNKLCQTETDLQDNQDLLKSTKLPANKWYDTIGFEYSRRKTHGKRYALPFLFFSVTQF